MYRPDIKNAIDDYFRNCNLNPERWDVDRMVDMIKRLYPNIVTIDDIPSDDFTDMLIAGAIAF